MNRILEAVEQEEKQCSEVETVRQLTYLGDSVSAGGGCETAVTARRRYGWINFRECGKLLHAKRFPLKLKWVVYKSYARPTIVYGGKYGVQ